MIILDCVKCRAKIKWFLIENRDSIDRKAWISLMTDINMRDNKIVLDRLAEL